MERLNTEVVDFGAAMASWSAEALAAITHSQVTHRLNGVTYGSGLAATARMNAHLGALVQRVTPHLAAFQPLAPRLGDGGVRLWLTVTTPDADPTVRLDAD